MRTKVKGYRNFRYKSKKTSPEVIKDLRQLSDSINKKLERKANLFKILLSVSIVFCCISFLLIFVVIGICLLPLFIIATLYCSHQTSKYYALQKNNYRYVSSEKIVSMLNRDIKENSILTTFIDFTLPVNKRKKVNKAKHPTRKNWKIINYLDPWLNIQWELCDRTKFKLNIAEYHRNSSGLKTVRGGKRKRKSKNKLKKMEISLLLIYSAKKDGAVTILEKEAIEAIKLAQDAKVKTFKISPKSILLTAYLPFVTPKSTYETVTSMFLSLYQILNLDRTLSKASN